MNDTFLYTLPQWFIFAAIFVVVYGWMEDKKAFRVIGASILIVLGIFSLFVIFGGSLAAGKFLTPNEIASEELADGIVDEIPFQAKLLPAYLSFVLSAVLAIPALILDIKDKKGYKLLIILSGLVSLFGFFIIVGVLKYI
jgi:hypothetical protein